MEYIFNENCRLILQYLQEHKSENVTVNDISAGVDLPPKTINGNLLSLTKRKYVYRTDNGEDKLIKLTPGGANVDPLQTKEE
jgi:DNA-binding IclR family transcriptional regulator